MIALTILLLSGLLWRLRGIMGWPLTLLFSLVQAATLSPAVGLWGLLIVPLILLGEPTGWKPKLVWDNADWKGSAVLGMRIALIGAIAVPLSCWLADKLPEPQIKVLQNTRWFKLPCWEHKKQLLNWHGSWNEVWFGMIFNSILAMGVVVYD